MEGALPLSDKLLGAQFKVPCPACGHALIRKGAWVKTVRGFHCENCKIFVALSYNDKLTIFDQCQIRD